MKVSQLLEARSRIQQDEFYVKDTVPSQKDKEWVGRYKYTDTHKHYASGEDITHELEDLKYTARIVLGMEPPVKTQGLDQVAVKDAYERAKKKFLEIRKAHPTQLRFDGPYGRVEAHKYMKTMEYPGWTLLVQYAGLRWEEKNRWGKNPSDQEFVYKFYMDVDWKNSRKVKTLELQAQSFKAPYEFDSFNIELDGDKVKVSCDEKTGPKFTAFMTMVSNAARMLKLTPYSAKGKINDIYYSRPQKVWFNTTDIGKVKARMEKWWAEHRKDLEAEHAKLQNKLQSRKEENKWRAEEQKARKAALYKKYGKHIIDRVKVKAMSLEGDDGYQWALFLDGRRHQSGMTQYQADGEQRMMWNWLLKWEKMTPKERLEHQNAVRGVEAYFAYEAMERSLEQELPKYLDAIKKNVKQFADTKQLAKDGIQTAMVSDAQAKKIFNDLMKRLGDKGDH